MSRAEGIEELKDVRLIKLLVMEAPGGRGDTGGDELLRDGELV